MLYMSNDPGLSLGEKRMSVWRSAFGAKRRGRERQGSSLNIQQFNSFCTPVAASEMILDRVFKSPDQQRMHPTEREARICDLQFAICKWVRTTRVRMVILSAIRCV